MNQSQILPKKIIICACRYNAAEMLTKSFYCYTPIKWVNKYYLYFRSRKGKKKKNICYRTRKKTKKRELKVICSLLLDSIHEIETQGSFMPVFNSNQRFPHVLSAFSYNSCINFWNKDLFWTILRANKCYTLHVHKDCAGPVLPSGSELAFLLCFNVSF